MCVSGFCTSSSLVPISICPFGDDLVMNGTEAIVLNTKYETCSTFINILTANGKSEAAFCASTNGKTNCCQTCLSNLFYFKNSIS